VEDTTYGRLVPALRVGTHVQPLCGTTCATSMIKTITDKLVAAVVEVTDLGWLFPASPLKGRIGLDVRVEQGSVSIGKWVRLSGPNSEEEVEIVGIEMLFNLNDPLLDHGF